ncbi:MAG: transposase [Planctomycetota bacterium]|nr:MAG: transposase [Planctomycetota bacterium]
MKHLVSDDLWRTIEPLMLAPSHHRSCFSRQKPCDHRKILSGILHVVLPGIPWDDLPADLGLGHWSLQAHCPASSPDG